MPYSDPVVKAAYQNTYRRGYTPEQRAAAIVRARVWKEANPERTRRNNQDSHLLRTYGVTLEQVQELSSRQGDRCAICGRHADEIKRIDSLGKVIDRLYVDHDPQTGQIRGLLCKDCNIALGLLLEEPVLLEVALEYLLCG